MIKLAGKLTLNEIGALLPPVYNATEGGLDSPAVIDLSGITFWDPAALLWLSLCLKSKIDGGFDMRLRLPDPNLLPPERSWEANRAQKSGDFLRRWRFDTVLRRIGGESLLVEEQRDYFSPAKMRNYIPRMVLEPSGKFTELMSTSLFPFFDFSALEYPDAGTLAQGGPSLTISRSSVNDRMRELRELAMAGIFTKNTRLSREDSLLFVRRIVGEALDNMERHPHATFGMMAISRSASGDRLCLAVVDDGESICDTILEVYNRDKGKRYGHAEMRSIPEVAAKVLDYSTHSHVSSDPNGTGMGLYYMKRHALDSFGGRLQILTSGVLCTYQRGEYEGFPHVKILPHGWNGNLLRVEIPIRGGND